MKEALEKMEAGSYKKLQQYTATGYGFFTTVDG